MPVETYPEGVIFTVVDDVTNRFRAERGDRSLACVTPDREKMQIDLFIGGSFPDEVKPIDLIGRSFKADWLGTAEYYANELTEVHPNAIHMKPHPQGHSPERTAT